MKYTPPIKEKAFQQQIVGLARAFGWKLYHPWNSIHSVAGFPDMVLVRERVIYAELKTETGKVSQAQQEWLDDLKNAGQEVYVWRPRDFDEIAEVLRSRRN